MNSILINAISILFYILLTKADAAAARPVGAPGTSITNAKGPEEVTAVVNNEANKDVDNFDIKPIETPVNKDKPVQTLDDVEGEAEEDGLVPISVLAVYANPGEIFNTPTPVFVAAQKYIEEAGAAGKPQNVRLSKDGAEGGNKEEGGAEPADKEKEKEEPATKEGAPKK